MILDSYVLLGKSDGDGGNMGVQRGGETSPVSRLHKFQFIFLKVTLNGVESAAQHHDFGQGKADQQFFRRGIRLLFQRRIGNPFGRQKLRVRQQVIVPSSANTFRAALWMSLP